MGRVPPAELALLLLDPRLAAREESIVCLACGRAFRQLTITHLAGSGSSPS